MKSVLLAMSLILVAVGAYAQDAAVVLHDLEHPFGCWAFGLHTSDEIHTVSTPSGNTKLICHFNIPTGQEPNQIVEKTGFPCGIYLPGKALYTTDTVYTANPGGRAKLQCTLKQ